MKLHILGLVVLLAWSCQEAIAGVITVQNLNTNTTIFEDDGFEDDAVGATALNVPTIGSYSQGATGKTVVNAGSPGAHDGTNYLKHQRVNSPTDFIHARFTSTVPNGEELKATFAINVDAGSTADITLFYLGNTPVAQLLAFGGQAQPWRMAAAPGFANEFPALPDPTGTWREVTINFAAGLFRLTVDGSSYNYTGTVDPAGFGALGVDRIVFNPGSAGSTYYLDAVAPIPEPSSIILVGLEGVIGGLMFSRHRWMK